MLGKHLLAWRRLVARRMRRRRHQGKERESRGEGKRDRQAASTSTISARLSSRIIAMDCVGSLSSLAESLLGGSGSGSGVRLSDDDHYQGESLDLLALGSGWTWSFLGPAAGERGLKTACTTRDGRNGSVRFLFDPESDDTAPFEALPDAKTIVVIFPLYSAEAAQRLVHGYLSTRAAHPAMHHGAYSTEKIDDKDTPVPRAAPHIILLGSTGIWNGGPTLQLGNVAGAEKACSPSKKRGPWVDRHAPVDDVPRAKGENALLAFNKGDKAETSVLCLAGLWGHGRSPRRFIARLAPTKEQLSKLTSVHFIHGHDVARALLAMHDMWDKARSERWLLTNERV